MADPFRLRSRAIAVLTLSVLFFVSAASAVIGANYGNNWDDPYLINGMEYTIEKLSLMPRAYIYSGMYFHVGYLGMGADLIRFFYECSKAAFEKPMKNFSAGNYPEIVGLQKQMLEKVRSEGYKVRVRSIYALISALGVFTIYLLIRGAGRPRMEALLGSGLAALSWEVNYHSRFIGVDSILMVLASVLLMCALKAADGENKFKWQVIGAAVAGLAMGSKVIGAMLLIPLWLTIFADGGIPFRRRAGRFFVVNMVAMSVFFVTSPRMFLDPVLLANTWGIEKQNYSMGYSPDHAHYVGSRLEFLLLTLDYFVRAVPSNYQLISVVFALFSFAGLYFIYKESPFKFAVFMSFPVVFLFSISSMKLLAVRNFLMFFPFFSFAAARGLGEAYFRFNHIKAVRFVLYLFLALWVSFNTYWLFYSARTVKPMNMRDSLISLSEYVRENPGRNFAYSESVLKEMSNYGLGGSFPIREADKAGDAYYVFLQREYLLGSYVPGDAEALSRPSNARFLANRRGHFKHVISSLEVNYDYYPVWTGRHQDIRLMVVKQ